MTNCKIDILYYVIFVAAAVSLIIGLPSPYNSSKGERYTYCDGVQHLYQYHDLGELPEKCSENDTDFGRNYPSTK